jgi:hypothetical protein
LISSGEFLQPFRQHQAVDLFPILIRPSDIERAGRVGLAKNFNCPLWFLSFLLGAHLPSPDKWPLNPDGDKSDHPRFSPSGTSALRDLKGNCDQLFAHGD